MRKIIVIVLGLFFAGSIPAQALESKLIDARTQIMQNSQEIKKYFATTRDPVLINSMWDSSVMTVSQLDAYFSMLGIFNTIKNENLSPEAFDYLINWLNRISESADLNAKTLGQIKSTADARSKAMSLKLKSILDNLKTEVAKEQKTVGQLQAAVQKK
jgi:hypothetical protein